LNLDVRELSPVVPGEQVCVDAMVMGLKRKE
jgi:hypothetical protein